MGLFSTNFGEAWRMAVGADASAKMLSFSPRCRWRWQLVAQPAPADLLVGLCQGGRLRLTVYGKARTPRSTGICMEYGSARWGNP